ncbi:MAG: hypothetical protein ABIW76_11025 [Fibrobacteria bacterium]
MIHPIPALRTRTLIARLFPMARTGLSAPMALLAIGSLLCLSACLSESGITPEEGEGATVAIDSNRIKDSLRVLDSIRVQDSIHVRDSIRVRDSIHVRDSLLALPMVFVVTSDYKTGSYSVHGLDSNYTKNNLDPIHSDAAVRYLGGDDIFVINRLGRDNLQIIDRHNLKTVLQIPLPALSNPYDVALKAGLIYVAFFGTDKIGIYRQSDGFKAGEIDVSAYADSSDKLPETSSLAFINGDLYALTANLDTKNGYVPLIAHLLRIDVGTKSVKQALALPYSNPAGLTWDSAANRIYVPCRGEYSNEDYSPKADGAIVAIDPTTLEVSGTIALEKDLGGNVNNALLYGGKLFMDVGVNGAESISAISVADGKAEEIVKLGAYAYGGLAIDAVTRTLYVGDRKQGGPGLRLFDLLTFAEKSTPGIDIGTLPPSNLAVIR